MHPYLFQFGRLVLPTYGFLVAIGTILSLLVCVRNARLLALDTDKIWSGALLSMATWLVVSKVLLVVLYGRQYGPRSLSMSMNGKQNFAVAGAAAIATAVTFSLLRQLPLLPTADAVAPSLALGSAFVSIACLEAGCDYGTPTNLPWAVVFRIPNRMSNRIPSVVSGAPLGVPLHPTQVYASLAAFATFVVLLTLLHRPRRAGEILGAWLFLTGFANAALAPLRGDPQAGLLSGNFKASVIPQLLSAAMVLAGAFLWMHRVPATQVQARG